MSQPVLSNAGQALYTSLAPLAYDDENQGWALAYLAGAIGEIFQPLDDLVGDTPDGPGWSQVLDIDRCPSFAFPWLGQFVGATVLSGLGDDEQRDRIKSIGIQRGSLAGLSGAARQHLTGSRAVIIRERDPIACPSEPAYGLTVITFTSETPDPTLTEADILAEKPAGLVLNYRTEDGQDFELLKTDYPTFGDVKAAYATFDDVRTNHP